MLSSLALQRPRRPAILSTAKSLSVRRSTKSTIDPFFATLRFALRFSVVPSIAQVVPMSRKKLKFHKRDQAWEWNCEWTSNCLIRSGRSERTDGSKCHRNWIHRWNWLKPADYRRPRLWATKLENSRGKLAQVLCEKIPTGSNLDRTVGWFNKLSKVPGATSGNFTRL